MVTFNLYPWRAYQAQYENKVLKKWVFGAFILLAISLLVIYIYQAVVWHHETSKEEALTQTSSISSGESTQHQSDVYAAWVSNRQQMLSRIDKLQMPSYSNVCLTAVDIKKDQILLKANAKTIEMMTEFLKYWSRLNEFSQVQVLALHQISADQMQFEVRAI